MALRVLLISCLAIVAAGDNSPECQTDEDLLHAASLLQIGTLVLTGDPGNEDENIAVDDPMAEVHARHTGNFTGCFKTDGTFIHNNPMGCSCLGEGDTLATVLPPAEVVARFDASEMANAYPAVEAVKPVAWFHCPKCGSSFQNVIYHQPDICPFTPPDVEMPHSSETCETPVPEFFAMYPPDAYCLGISPTWTLESASYHHRGLTDATYLSNKGRFMGMIRQPEQRHISAWNHGMHSWGHRDYRPTNVKEFAEGMQGCMTRMLGSHESGHNGCGMSLPLPEGLPSSETVQVARTRLREGFSFVGLTDRWEESICLFHAMFGGPCLDLEFDNTRQGYSRFDASEPYDTSELEGFVDVYDGAVYEEAASIFNTTLRQYDINFETCASLCPSHFTAA